ncbi:TetR/AcrR family transcriptional regulator [Pseudonocardia kunmingensis]|uniref:TetR family transcriptional regulator n=1 Tax=Pseudonocardia kunmingensis TaxID=630975 RepID=A0A543E101_9PSEU|nr:TetR/AcrR family transcriptional regulator [Pseudonocardia kunmingensis]TQM15275.1 TetR family transcriptional regulator [Pseudonocardia kunmingensis]
MRTTAPGPPGRRDVRAWAERTDRILDRAAESVLAVGHSGTTVEAVARGAGVAKGTIYLHFPSREALFTAVLRRERLALVTATAEGVAADAGAATPHGVVAASVRALQRRPLLGAVLRRDADVLGRLAGSEPVPEMPGTARGFAAYLDELREAGLVRTDLPTAELLAVVAAVLLGFLTTGALLPAPVPPDRLPDLVAGTVERALDRGCALAPADVARTARITTAYLATAVEQATAAYRLAAGIAAEGPA